MAFGGAWDLFWSRNRSREGRRRLSERRGGVIAFHQTATSGLLAPCCRSISCLLSLFHDSFQPPLSANHPAQKSIRRNRLHIHFPPGVCRFLSNPPALRPLSNPVVSYRSPSLLLLVVLLVILVVNPQFNADDGFQDRPDFLSLLLAGKDPLGDAFEVLSE